MEEPAVDPQAGAYRSAVERARLPLAVGLVVAGATVALGYLLGLVQGPLPGVVGGIALMTLGRGLGRSPSEGMFLCAGLGVLAGAWSVGAMRWSTLMLDDLRGAQGVLGPTLIVGSPVVVLGLALAAGAAILALAVWAATPPVPGRAPWVRGLEVTPGALATVTVFWGPAVAGARPANLAVWGSGVGLLLLISSGGTVVLGGEARRRLALVIAASALLVGALLVAWGL